MQMPTLSVLLERFQRTRQPNRDRYAITDDRSRCLSELIRRPTNYTQRFVEELSFVPGGGQKWTRTLQVRLPQMGEAAEPTWWIVSLGPFARRRFPDLVVTNAAGKPLKLLTRDTHGKALTTAILGRSIHQFRQDERRRENLYSPDGRQKVREVQDLLRDFYTDIGSTRSRIDAAKTVAEAYESLLKEVGFTWQDIETELDSFVESLVELTDTTQYLCWIHAAPGDTIHLEASHTVRDPKHKLEDGSFTTLLQALWIGIVSLKILKKDERKTRIIEAANLPPARRWLRHLPLRFDGAARREKQADWFRQYSLAPINYGFNVPTYRYSASYYATLAPPANAFMTYVDWETSNSFDTNSEIDCALHSIHVYNPHDSEGRDKTFRTTRAYVRCAPHHHKQILMASALNFVVVWLLIKGHLLGTQAGALQGLVVASPSLWIAFLAQQQRHYYAHALRRSRAILWAYLVIALAFLIAVASSGLGQSAGEIQLNLGVRICAWLLAVSSVGVLLWNLPLGQSYDRVVRFLRNRKVHAIWEPEKLGPVGAFINALWWVRRQNKRVDYPWKCYEVGYESYSRFIWRTAAVGMLGAVAVLYFVLQLTPY